MVEFYPDDETEMRIADVRVPGVYHVKEQGGGYTSEYIAQHIRQRATAAYTPSGGGDTSDTSGDGDARGVGGDPSGGAGPPSDEDWEVLATDNFSGGTLNTSIWDYGFGWGMTTDASDEDIDPEMVSVEDGMLRLTARHDGGPGSVRAGAVHSSGKVSAGPGSYWEAKLRTPARVGWLPAFWAKPVSEAWPPEIDFFEALGGRFDRSHHHLHYSASGGTGGGDNDLPMSYDGIESTTDWHIYGCAWYRDRIEMYVDETHVGTHTHSTAMDSMAAGAPFYMMLNIHVGKGSTPDYSEQWSETMDVDWVNVWTLAD